MSSSNSPCAACKFLRRKCTQGCVFAPYFPPDQPTKFVHVHKVFGASNVAKILNDLPPVHREDAVNSLAYEAQARLNDPVLGCVGYIYLLEQKLNQVRHDLDSAKKELSTYIGPAAYGAFVSQSHNHGLGPPYHAQQFQFQIQGAPPASQSSMPPFAVPGVATGMGLGLAAPTTTLPQAQLLMREPNQQQQQQQRMADEAQQLAMAVAAATTSRGQEMLRSYEQQQELARFNLELSGGVREYNQMALGGATVAVAAPQGLVLVPAQPLDAAFPVQQQQQQTQQSLQFRDQYLQPRHQRSGSDEGRSGIGPSSS